MKVRDLILRLARLDRDDAEVGVMTIEAAGGVTIQPAREATLRGTGPDGGDDPDDAAVIIVGGRPPRRPAAGPSRTRRPRRGPASEGSA